MRSRSTEKMEEIIHFINSYRDENEGICPTTIEIGQACGISQPTASRFLKEMDAKGMISYSGLRDLRTGWGRPAEGVHMIPVVGSIACGDPKLAEENIEEYIPFKGDPEKYFALRADGTSMINAHIDDGDLVMIRRQTMADPGQIVIALIDNEETTLKRYYPKGKGLIELRPENDELEPRIIDLKEHDLKIQGVAVSVTKAIE